ncbi:putative membrane protein [Flavobacterium sp. 28YEA47A]|uniref:hypothetical protein n=1 Tax=Flavobacterium sp. 28YEA47A TaxID=3156276 RepID=UPI0035162013
MKFQEITFTDTNAKRLYKDYIGRVKHAVKDLSKENQHETLLEINSHIYEAFSLSNTNEVESLLDIFDKLGRPEIFLKELVSEKKLEEATKTFNPVKIIKALLLNITNGISYIIFLILYLSLFSFVFLIFAKIFDPENVGFFYRNNDIFVLGKISSSSINYRQYEQLGNLFIPIMAVSAFILFVIITFLLKLSKRLKNK